MPSSNSPIDKIISIQSFESDGKLKLLRGYIGGGFQVNDDFISGSILLAPRDVQQFPVSDASQLTLELLASHIDIIEPELFLIGVGGNPKHLYQQFRDYFKKRAIGLDIMSTASACRTWNVLQSEGRKVAACLIAII